MFAFIKEFFEPIITMLINPLACMITGVLVIAFIVFLIQPVKVGPHDHHL